MKPAASPTLRWVEIGATVLAWVVILAMIVQVLLPILVSRNTVGGHDWDQMESHRYLITKTILRFHQFPFWNPYACGGHPNWAGIESGTTIVSPWLPFYLGMSLPHALRVEVVGSALLSALGAWLLGGRFTRSPGARALVAVVFAVNGRWALQITSGHTWHLAYAWTPWVLYFYDRAVGADPRQGTPRRRDAILAGACLAMMVYAGGIYPLPQTILLVALYGTFLAARLRSIRPLVVGLVSGLFALGLSAPKLFPVLDMLRRFPRLVESTESIDLTAFFALLTAPQQDMFSRPANVGQWGWHEYGMYVGWLVVITVACGCILGRGPRESPLKWTGVVLLFLGFGAFDPHAPWTLLHQFALFRSQHVPSRWLYPALLCLAVVAVGAIEHGLQRTKMARVWFELVLVVAVAWTARDIAAVAEQPITHMFTNRLPATVDATSAFYTEIHLPAQLNFAPDYSPPSLPAEIGNFGTIDCTTFPGLNNFVRDRDGRASGLGARGRGDPLYRGEVYVAEGGGHAAVASWSPNAVTVRVTGARPATHLVLNQNWDAGWSANGSGALDWADQVAADLHGPDETIVFRYVPRYFVFALFVFVATLGGIAYAYVASRRGATERG